MKSKLLVSPQQSDQSGCILRITPESAGWKYVGFEVFKLLPGQVTPQLSKPKSIEGIPFDVSPVPVEVPRRSLAADYSRTASNP